MKEHVNISKSHNKNSAPIMEDMGNGLVKIIDGSGNAVILKKEQVKLMSQNVESYNSEGELLLG